MKNTNKARQVSDPLMQEILGTLTPLEKEKTRVEMLLAANIADAMADREISKSALAARVGKQPSEVTKWLSGTHNFTVATLVEICEALEIKIEQIFHPRHPSVIDLQRFTIQTSRKQPVGTGGFGGSASKAKSHRFPNRERAHSPAINFG